ncbi:hypothetical protein AVEN109717_09480 [Avibacterium endocarditidis]
MYEKSWILYFYRLLPFVSILDLSYLFFKEK